MYLVLSRDAGTQGKLELQLVGTGSAALQAKQLTVDGKPSPISDLAWKATDDGALTLDDPALIASFLSQVRNAKRMGSNAGKSDSVSLAGLDASLLFIDEQQGRLNTTTALAQPGTDAPDQVPAAAPAPVLPPQAGVVDALTAAQSSELLRAVRAQAATALKTSGCSTDPGAPDDADEAFRLTATDALVFVTCNDGAYQGDALVYRAPIDGKPATRLVLPPLAFKVDSTDAVTFDTLVGGDYDPGTATLSYLNKGRGVGDCGDSATWRFDGNAFVLASYSSLGRCGGVLPDDWPVYWRTTAAVR